MIQEFYIYESYIEEDKIGGYVEYLMDYGQPIKGYLDLLSGSNRQFNKELGFTEEATHVLIVPQFNVNFLYTSLYNVYDPLKNKTYRVTYIDNPVGVNHHLEIYLKEL